jgi:hypothetical protein
VKTYIRSIVRFFRCDPRQIIGLLTELEVECLAVEAMLSRATKVDVRPSQRLTMLGYPAYEPEYVSIERTN